MRASADIPALLLEQIGRAWRDPRACVAGLLDGEQLPCQPDQQFRGELVGDPRGGNPAKFALPRSAQFRQKGTAISIRHDLLPHAHCP